MFAKQKYFRTAEMSSKIKNVVCAMSGGIDSCVAALLLKRQGYNVHGVFMRNWDIADEKGFCQADIDKADAEYVCRKINIPFSEVNFVKEYWHNVFSYIIQDYSRGITPNPDILCNKLIKFNTFLKHALNNLGADAIATGHYARIIQDKYTKRYHLFKGIDQYKDQTFFLGQIPIFSLEKCMFPLGEMTKNEVKKIAAAAGFHQILLKKESMGICFIGRRNFQDFIDEYIESKSGNFINIENREIIGQHKGVHCWTIGQRCMIGGKSIAYYVAERNCINQEILVAPGRYHPALFHHSCITEAPYWINPPPVDLEKEHFVCDFRFQHREPPEKCMLYKCHTNYLQVLLKNPLRAVSPGQYAVFYANDECLGSAKILFRGPSMYSIQNILSEKIT